MHLYVLSLGFVLAGLVLYIVLGGADFGVGVWELTAGRGRHADALREHAHASMAPVWEANHVWLIFVLTVFWTAFPVAFESIFSTLSVPLFLAGLGIVLRGASYALGSGARPGRESRALDAMFAGSSILTPFALGTVIGGIAAQRVPVGDAAGHPFSSWLNPTAIAIGCISVVVAAYLAAVFLAADAARRAEPEMERAFRSRALAAGAVAGVVAVAGLIVVRLDSPVLGRALLTGAGLPALIVSALAGVATVGLVAARRYEPARYSAAAAVAAIVCGWALAQHPRLLAHLTIGQAAAPHDTQLLLVIAVLVGGSILFPSLALLLRLTLGGRLGAEAAGPPAVSVTAPDAGRVGAERTGGAGAAAGRVLGAARRGVLGRSAVACGVAGAVLLVFGEAGWSQALGVVGLVGFILLGFAAAGPVELADSEP